MTVVINGTSGITNVNGSAAAPAETGVDTDTGVFFPAANTLGFSTNGAEVARFDSSGNLGLGVTPSAWSLGKAIEVGNLGSAIWSYGPTFFTTNYYYNSVDKFAGTGYALTYVQSKSGGSHSWNISTASGSAGATASLTQAMTLDASGNLGVGTTSPSTRLHLYGASNEMLRLESSSTSYDAALRIFQNGTQITNLQGGVGVTGGGTFLTTVTSAPLVFGTANTERARIDSSGNLLVGTTTASGKIFAVNDASSARQCIRGDQSYDGAAAIYGRHTVNSATGFCAYFTNSGSGTGLYIANTAAWQSTSDARLKTDVQDLDSTARLMQLRPVDYLWKNQATSNEPTKRSFGFIAQEVQEVFPELVSTSPDEMLGVEYTGLIAPLVKAIQEQQAIITQLQADVAALKAQ